MTWSSVRANVDRKIPRLTAPIDSSSAIRKARNGEPAESTPSPIENAGSGPMAGTAIEFRMNSVSAITWIVAKIPNPRLYPSTISPRVTGVGEQSLQRAADALAQEADAGQQEDEEVAEEAEEDRRQHVDLVRVGREVDGLVLDLRDDRRRHAGRDELLRDRARTPWSFPKSAASAPGSVPRVITRERRPRCRTWTSVEQRCRRGRWPRRRCPSRTWAIAALARRRPCRRSRRRRGR